MCFTEPEQNFLNNKQREVSNYCGVPKIHIFTTNQHTQNDMSHLRQITHPVKNENVREKPIKELEKTLLEQK